MESEEDHTGRQIEAITQSGSLKHYLSRVMRKGTQMTSASFAWRAGQSAASQYAMYD